MADKEPVRIEDFKGLRVAYLRDKGLHHNVAPPLMRKLRMRPRFSISWRARTLFSSPSLMITRKPLRAGKFVWMRSRQRRAKFPFQLRKADLNCANSPAGPHAVYRHVGSYKNLREAWTHMVLSCRCPAISCVGRRWPLEFRDLPESIRRTHRGLVSWITELYQPVEAVR